MQMIPISSGGIVSIGYDRNARILRVESKSSNIFDFYNVSTHIYINFLSSPNKTKYFHSSVRGRYKVRKIKKD
ncbi:KTSC domain-containing protein [Clostridium sp. CCUG 7971]|uniref:KTSC domain-containing protein n=1 Tax=Clostridium sp. CCUG 7971 TaxID=2811414 RepID=UPI001ABA7EE6|nr:KTSC domain-containing protein [Clostridium sp. CCUG 7971]MBO3446384.1 KTSC domain-containing protein [Clostridium sp. CCUG 7971]